MADVSTIGQRVRVGRLASKRLFKIGECLRELAEGVADDATVVPGRSVTRIAAQGLLQVGQCPFGIALLEALETTLIEAGGVLWVGHHCSPKSGVPAYD